MSIVKLKLKHDEFVMLAIVYLYSVLCPYNKVEESFNTQAVHDIVYWQKFIYYYDHIQFPGVVPRTFLGAVSVALPAGLIATVTQCSRVVTYHIARAILGLYVVWSFSAFRRAVKNKFGKMTGNFLVALTCTQFHILFYASRTLPNTFALCAVLLATAHWLTHSWDGFLWWAGLGVLVLRSELVILLGPMLLMELVRGKVDFKEVYESTALSVKLYLYQWYKIHVMVWNVVTNRGRVTDLMTSGAQIGLFWLVLSISIDSYLWRYTVWPEMKVLYYNTWLNKSGDWGTMPFLWYFYSALPRLLLTALPLSVIGCLLERRLLSFTAPALLFIALYSLLPHKELRFIFYAVPMLNVAAAHVCTTLWRRCSLTKLVVAGSLCTNLLCSAVLLSASYYNYPGGEALLSAHTTYPCQHNTTIYITNYAAQTGASRFGEKCGRQWMYYKIPDMPIAKVRNMQVLILEPKEAHTYRHTHVVIDKISGYAGLDLTKEYPFLSVKLKHVLYILKNKTVKKKLEIKQS